MGKILKLLLSCTFIILVMSIVLLIYRNNQLQFIINSGLGRYLDQKEELKRYEKSISLHYVFNNIDLSSDNLIFNEDEEIVELESYFKDSMLIVRLNQYECGKCNKKLMDQLNTLISSREKVIIITNYKAYDFKLEFPDCRFKTLFCTKLNLDIEKNDKSYLFLIDNNFKCSDLLLFYPEFKEVNHSYLIDIDKKLK